MADTGRCGRCKQPLPPVADPIDADAALFDEIIREAAVPVLVDFWAAWCAPCRVAAPDVARAAADLAGRAIVLKVDTERHPELAARYEVRSIPYFALFIDGELRWQQAGVLSHHDLERIVLETA